MYYIGLSLLFCLLNAVSADKLTESNPIYNELVSLANEEVTGGHPFVVNGVYSKVNGDEENEFVVRLEVEKNPSVLCSVTIIDSPSPDKYIVIDKQCQNEVEEQVITAEKRPMLCAGCPEPGSVHDPLAIEAANFALSHYNNLPETTEQGTEVNILSVKSQIVAGVNHFLELEFIKDGKVVKKCNVTVWSKPWLKFKKVTEMQCASVDSREAKEVFTGEDEIKDVSQKFVQNVVLHTMKALNDLYKSSTTKKLSKGIEKASLKQTVNGPLYELVLDVDSVECLKPWKKDGSCDEKFQSVVRETCTLLVSDQSRILPILFNEHTLIEYIL